MGWWCSKREGLIGSRVKEGDLLAEIDTPEVALPAVCFFGWLPPRQVYVSVPVSWQIGGGKVTG